MAKKTNSLRGRFLTLLKRLYRIYILQMPINGSDVAIVDSELIVEMSSFSDIEQEAIRLEWNYKQWDRYYHLGVNHE